MIEWFYKTIDINTSIALSFLFVGALLIILFQNALYYFNRKDKTFLWYSLFIFLLLCHQVLINYNAYFYFRYQKNLPFATSMSASFMWLYNSTYIIFVIWFGGKGLFTREKALMIKRVVYSLGGVLAIGLLITVISNVEFLETTFLFVMVPILLLFSVYFFIHVFRMKSAIRNYILLGGLAFTVFSLTAFILAFVFSNIPLSRWIFYLGIIIVNIFFSVGMVIKQKIYLEEQNASQNSLIIQLRKNQKIRSDLEENLKKKVAQKTLEVITLSKKAEESKINKIEMGYEKAMAELKISSLQSQMNPHFIFNSLNSIKLYIIKNDKENAVYYLNKFSKLIRKILSASREKEVSLSEELETIELYINIENIRFKNSIDYEVTVEEGIKLSTSKIPPLILQPFVENAIWHGLSSKNGKKKLSIEVSKRSDNYIRILIADNGIGRKKATDIRNKKLRKKESIGLKLTEERLSTFSKNYSNEHKLTFEDLEENDKPIGTKVTLDLPIK